MNNEEKQLAKYDAMVQDYFNGNRLDFYNAVKKLDKLKTLDFIERAQSMGLARHITINEIRWALKKK